jgi:hypothetical protein
MRGQDQSRHRSEPWAGRTGHRVAGLAKISTRQNAALKRRRVAARLRLVPAANTP